MPTGRLRPDGYAVPMAQTSSGLGAKIDIDLQSLRIVRAIAETGSITGASRALGYSQPAISQHLQRAEARLGMPLITRAGRSVRLSEAGLVLSRHAPEVTAALAAVAEELGELASMKSGRVRLVAFPSASSTVVPRLLSRLRETKPGISISYQEAEPPEAAAMLRDGQCDLAITFSYPGDGFDAEREGLHGFTIAPLYIDPLFLILPADHPLADERVVDLISLEDDQWIAGCPRCRGNLLAACHEVGFSPSISYETDNFVAVLGMVASGLGVALLPRLALGTAALPTGAVVRRANPASHRVIHLVTTPEANRTPALAATIATMAGIDGSEWKLMRPAAPRISDPE